MAAMELKVDEFFGKETSLTSKEFHEKRNFCDMQHVVISAFEAVLS